MQYASLLVCSLVRGRRCLDDAVQEKKGASQVRRSEIWIIDITGINSDSEMEPYSIVRVHTKLYGTRPVPDRSARHFAPGRCTGAIFCKMWTFVDPPPSFLDPGAGGEEPNWHSQQIA